jgi:hypothetical protein
LQSVPLPDGVCNSQARISEDSLATLHPTPLAFIAFVCAVLSASILVYYLVRRPALTPAVKVLLFVGIGPLPIGVAAAGNFEGFQATEKREFCGSCHVMAPHATDSNDRASVRSPRAMRATSSSETTTVTCATRTTACTAPS